MKETKKIKVDRKQADRDEEERDTIFVVSDMKAFFWRIVGVNTDKGI